MAARPGRDNHNWRPALERFAEKCEFDPATGCVTWRGGTSAGRGNTTRYGVFWDQGRRVFAHRWAAVHIHGIDLGNDDAGHCCPQHNSLCVQHLQGQTRAENVAERNRRVAKGEQLAHVRQHFLFVQLGIEQPEHDETMEMLLGALDSVPFHTPPEWFRPFMKQVSNDDDCPF